MPRCCVQTCKSSIGPMRIFPSTNDEAMRIWVQRVGYPKLERLSKADLLRFRVCDKHFTDYCRNPFTKKLNPGSLPTLALPNFSGEPSRENSNILYLSGYNGPSDDASSFFCPPPLEKSKDSSTIYPSQRKQHPLISSGHDYYKIAEKPPRPDWESAVKEKLTKKGVTLPILLRPPQPPLNQSENGVPRQPELPKDLEPEPTPEPEIFDDDSLYGLVEVECGHDDNGSEPTLFFYPLSTENDETVDAPPPSNVVDVDGPCRIAICPPFIVAEHKENTSVKLLVKLDPFPDKLTPEDGKVFLEKHLRKFAEQIAGPRWQYLPSYDSDSDSETTVRDISNMKVYKKKDLARNPSAFQELFNSLSEPPVISDATKRAGIEILPIQKFTSHEKSRHKDTEAQTTVPGIDLDISSFKLPLSGTKFKETECEKGTELPPLPIVVYQKYFDKDLYNKRVQKLKVLNKELKSKVNKLEKMVEKLKKQKLTINNVLGECKKYMKPDAYEICASQIKIGYFRTKSRGSRWSEEMKKLAASISDESTYAFKIFSRIFHFPSKGLLCSWRAKQKKAEMAAYQIDGLPPDHQYATDLSSLELTINQVVSDSALCSFYVTTEVL